MTDRFRAASIALLTLLGVAVAVSSSPTSAAAEPAAVASVPRPDHVVVVVEENHSGSGIIGNLDAPYISSLAANNANFTASYALTHPSQPNYLGLFSGSTQGLTDDTCPHTYTAPSLGDRVLDAGLRFTGYSEGLPAVGSGACTSGHYVRKHSPWTNFPSLPASTNQPFGAFPSDYSTLPEVSFVIPNLVNDMHDGTVAQGDTWLRDNLSGYVEWAKTHNSLFVLTFDEDDNRAGNQIPTVMAGQRVRPGTYPQQINHYNVLRTITDAYGLAAPGNAATANPIIDVWTPPAGDQAPVPSFTSSCSQLACSFDARASSDPDGTINGWSWDFGDGASTVGAQAAHTFATGGTYNVRLTVSDDQGAAASTTRPTTVTEPPTAPFASDNFARTSANGWGSADRGGPWTVTGASANYAVANGAATMNLAPSAGAYLNATTRADTDLSTTLSVGAVPTGGPIYPYVVGRRVSSGNEYDVRLTLSNSQRVNLWLVKFVAGRETALTAEATVPNLTFAAGTRLTVRTQVTGTGPTTVRARVWPATGAEPTGWNATATDTTAGLQAAGSVGVTGYLSSKVTNGPIPLSVSALSAKSSTAPPANQPPTAAFTSSCTELSCAFDAAASADPDGSVTGYAWDFGDGAGGTGRTIPHAYVTDGSYVVRLTVTDNGGATSTTTRTVVVTGPPPEAPPEAVFVATCARLTCAFDATASHGEDEIESWAWTFGDATAGSGATTSHTFAAAGTYPVRLTVTDEDGATGSITHDVTVTAAPAPFVTDRFARSVSSGWGSADTGGAWSGTASSAFSVAGGAGHLRLSGTTLQSAWVGPARGDADLVTVFSADTVPVGGPVYPYVTGRRVSTGNEYDARVTLSNSQRVNLWLVKYTAGKEASLTAEATVPGLTFAAGTELAVRMQVSGSSPTTIRARIWPAGAAEPTTWNATATDSTAGLQAPGSVGLRCYPSSKLTNAPVNLDVASVTATVPGG